MRGSFVSRIAYSMSMYSSVGWRSSWVTITSSTSMRGSQRPSEAHLEGDHPDRRGVGRREHVVVDRAAEVRPHRALARRRAEDQPHALGDLLVARDEREPPGGVDPHRVGDATADEQLAHRAHPTFTVGAPITIGAPQPAMSPTRSAGRPPIITVMLPIGNGVGGCTAGGGKLHVCRSPTTAAGIPAISTVGDTRPGDRRRDDRSGHRLLLRTASFPPPSSVDRHDRAAHRRLPAARDLGRAAALDLGL